MKTMAFTFIVLSMLSQGGAQMIPRTWCTEVLAHGALARDLQGNVFVMDSWQLRKFTDQRVRKWYQTGRSPICILKSADVALYQYGSDINFRPDQDLENPMLLQVSNQTVKMLWYRGRVHKLQVKPAVLKLKDSHVYNMSRLAIESLPQGENITSNSILEGTVVQSNEKYFLYTRYGLRPIKQSLLSRINPAPTGPLSINDSKLATHAVGKPFQLINSYSWPSNILVRGSHPERIYLLKGNKRYYLWSHWALTSRGWDQKPVQQLTDDELYLIPYAGNIY